MSHPSSEASGGDHVRPDPGLPLRRVLIVDDHPLFSQGLAGLLTQALLVASVDLADSVDQAAALLAAPNKVDLVLLDVSLQGETGLMLLPRMIAREPPVPVVVISSSEDETTVRAARAAGARGFLPKSAGRTALFSMFRTISRGGEYFPGRPQPAAQVQPLTPRQMEVLSLLAQGFPNKRICQSLNLTEHTVKTHLKAIFAHLGVHNRTECVSQARQVGWL
ncbi:response regulator transcription factor [Marinobacter sp. F4206]|uniref:response regulator transcription factor n=1 Tax=Marinobacter sp. F4206 TaxID=2861777 RepID=UPI001C5CF6A0|nr:response regulator transcription factor [Marinobacter sp. F4206]MBW4934610.1 response regulator transcription factor [Marinobacter sp. F4206]